MLETYFEAFVDNFQMLYNFIQMRVLATGFLLGLFQLIYCLAEFFSVASKGKQFPEL